MGNFGADFWGMSWSSVVKDITEEYFIFSLFTVVIFSKITFPVCFCC